MSDCKHFILPPLKSQVKLSENLDFLEVRTISFRSARKKAGISVLDAAEKLGVSDAAIYMWETGQTKPRTDKLVKLAEIYGCTVDDLLRGDDE